MSAYLKRMANAIDASKAPDRNRVINDLRRLIAGTNDPPVSNDPPGKNNTLTDVEKVMDKIGRPLANIDRIIELKNLLVSIMNNSEVDPKNFNTILTEVRKGLKVPSDSSKA